MPSVELSIMYFKPILKLQNLFSLSFAIDYIFGPTSARSYKIGVVSNNWLVDWLVGRLAVFSETARRIFPIFCMKLGEHEGRKVAKPDFWKIFLIWRYSRKGLQISPKSDTLIFFSKTAVVTFMGFGLQSEWNLFFRKYSNLEIFDYEIVKKLPKLRFLAIFPTLHH